MKTFARMLIVNIVVLIVLIGAGFTGYYFYNQSANYIKTDNAQIDGQMITVAAPMNGKLTDWNGEVGKAYDTNDTLGTIEGASDTGGKMKMDIKLPKQATIVKQDAVKDSFVAAGTPLAQAYNMDNLWVTANIDENAINDVEKGQKVDIYVDAYPNQTLEGKIDQIGLTTAGTFSVMPSSNSNGNYTKVKQVIPVKISINDYKGVNLKPGMNVTVKIHK
ncbi:HlyD family efflux transporter periplasmic adaptor subunit [Camelliibacillus cellulosilyticus]|uniref:HlyD family efflux transporter periplasmic adaptor subunit n=1 Tax=Camelliibacillus cellulosilyticus TaxID=2174486 RepID=A0ABV9GI91_9BACL